MFHDETQNQIPHALFRVTLPFREKLTGDAVQEISAALEDISGSVLLHNREAADGDDWAVEIITHGTPDLDHIFERLSPFAKSLGIGRDDLSAERLPEKDWLRHVHESFPPITVGRFFIRGSHREEAAPVGLTPLQIDAATAFGSGEHETTKGCLLSLEFLANGRVFENILDMGCGSGILAIAAQKIWPKARVTAIDIDPESILVTKRHAQMNGAHLTAEAGDGFRAVVARERGPYDLILANILADPLIAMADDFSGALSPKGFCVLSGLLARQEEAVTAAYIKAGFQLVEALPVSEWRALILCKRT